MAASNVVARGKYFFHPVIDGCLITLLPILSLIFSVFIWEAGLKDTPSRLFTLAIAFSNMHLIVVVFRTHANTEVFKRHLFRFVHIPILMTTGVFLSEPFFLVCVLVGLCWDIWHMSMQTFGIGRIYDQRLGTSAHLGREADIALALTIFSAPFFAGPHFVTYFERHFLYDQSPPISSFIMSFIANGARFAQIASVVVGISAVIYVIWVYGNLIWRRPKDVQFQIASQKVILYFSTLISSWIGWVYCPFPVAILIAYLIHSIQYLAIVWWSESPVIANRFGFRFGWAVYAGVALTYAVFGFFLGYTVFGRICTCVGLLHNWYDGFIWSTRKQHVRN